MLTKTILTLALAAASLSAHALNFIEGTDLPNAASFTPAFSVSVGTLDVGANTVSGTISSAGCTIPNGSTFCFLSGDTQDSFLFTVAPGTFVQSVGVTFSNVVGAGIRTSLQVQAPSGAVFVNNVMTVSNTTFSNQQQAIIPAGVYSASLYFQADLVGGTARTVPWNIALNVVAVPEPASALLLACGGLALWLRRRWHLAHN